MISILICEEERAEADRFERIMLNHYQGGEYTLHAFVDTGQALGFIKSGAPVDIAFLCTHLPGMPGTRLAEAFRMADFGGHIVLLWDPEKPRMGAAGARAVKPFANLERPLQPVHVLRVLGHAKMDRSLAQTASITLTSSRMVRRVLMSEILYVEEEPDFLRFHLSDGEAMTVGGDPGRYLSRLGADPRFASPAPGIEVNLDCVAALTERDLLLTSGERLPLSRKNTGFMQRWEAWSS